MGEVVSYPFGTPVEPAAPPARLTPALVQVADDRALGRRVDAGICAAYVELLDDLLLRHEGLGSTLAGQYGDTAGIWLADAHKLRAEIARRPVQIRMAVGVAERVGGLAILIAATTDAMDLYRAKNVGETDDGFLRDARAANEELKARLVPVAARPDDIRAAVPCPAPDNSPGAPRSVVPSGRGSSGDVRVRVTEPLTPPTIRVRRNAARVEACSVLFHLRAAASAFGAMLAAFLVPADPFAHIRPLTPPTLGAAQRSVTRNETTVFRAPETPRPGGVA